MSRNKHKTSYSTFLLNLMKYMETDVIQKNHRTAIAKDCITSYSNKRNFDNGLPVPKSKCSNSSHNVPQP
eukprot:2204681-Amphidinium_carterae.1